MGLGTKKKRRKGGIKEKVYNDCLELKEQIRWQKLGDLILEAGRLNV